MRLYAILNNNEVIETVSLTEEQCAERSTTAVVVDIEDQIPRPDVGWVLDGNKLVPNQSNIDPDALDAIQQSSQRLYGLRLLPIAIDMVGARNLKLAREGTPANVSQLAVQMQTVKILLEGGALKTARTLCESLKPGFPVHADILQYVIDHITNFLVENNWN